MGCGTIPTKPSGDQLHQGVLVKVCGNLRAAVRSLLAARNLRHRHSYAMSDNRPKREAMAIEDATISNMWEIAAIVEVLERKGLCTKQDLYDIITEFRRKNPRARIPETAFPEPCLLTETENTIIDDMLELLNKHGLTSHQSQNLLERLGRIIEMGQRLAKGTTHRPCEMSNTMAVRS